MAAVQEETLFKELQRNRYEGQIDPVTKLRHGEGRYNYRDDNSCFQYQGAFDLGIKHT